MRTFRIPFTAMASACEVVLAIEDETKARELAQVAIAEVSRIEAKYSRYRADSIVSQINAAAGVDAVVCDDETWALLEYANAIYLSSDRLFDITSGVLRRVWNFRTSKIPTDEALASALQLIGWDGVERYSQRIRLPKLGMEIDFGGFGKEYAADRAANVIRERGFRHGYVNLAGDIRVLGPRPDGSPWMIGIRDPRQSDQVLATIPVEIGGLATSGDYERFFEIDGHRYCHILEPTTGQPVTYWRTVSVLAPLTVIAGNCTTIAMLKQSAGLAFLEASGMAYLAVDQQGTIYKKAAAD